MPDGTALLRTALAALLLAALLVTFTPFVLQEASGADQGNVVNQLGYSALAAIAIFGHFVFTPRAVALSLLRPAWLLTIGALLASVTQALVPGDALRALLFTVMGMIAGTGAICLPPTARDFRRALAFAAFAVIGLCYAGIVLFPSVAMHTGDDHAGLWRGIYSHKNVAGPIMAMLMFAGFYMMRSGERWTGAAIGLLAAFFIYKTGSKTTLALTPAVALLVLSGRIFGSRALPTLMLFVMFVGIALFTLGAAISPTLDAILQWVLPATTFTGRLDLWRFTIGLFEPRQWTGYGIESFWSTDIVYKAEKPFELSWDPRLIVNSHNGYLELAVWGGWITLAIASLTLVWLPLKDYLTTRTDSRENTRLADFCMMVLAFMLLNSFLESYLFSRANAIWMFGWLAIVGLRLTSRFRLD